MHAFDRAPFFCSLAHVLLGSIGNINCCIIWVWLIRSWLRALGDAIGPLPTVKDFT